MKDIFSALRTLSAATPDFDQPAMEERLRRAFAQHHASRAMRARNLRRWLAAAAIVVVACGSAGWWLTRTDPTDSTAPQASADVDPAGHLSDFVPLPGASTLPEFERGDIVRIEVPVANLAAYGFDMVPDAAPEYVAADLLIGQDGVPRAIRLAADYLP